MRTLAPARGAAAARAGAPAARRCRRAAELVGGDVAARVGGGERRGRAARRRALRSARSAWRIAARRERRDERPAVCRELLQAERARVGDRQRERDGAAHERSRARARARPSTGGARSSRSRPGAEDACRAGRAHVERLGDEPVAHALGDAAGAAVGGDLVPEQRGRAADVRRRAGGAAVAVVVAAGEPVGLVERHAVLAVERRQLGAGERVEAAGGAEGLVEHDDRDAAAVVARRAAARRRR